ncbi:triose-phosphate isomerase [Tenacibaculum sp. SG-28]|uniref:triose-phosphate isomerase n=1 Tax=Tenacibaculum sp. SG-28 TaxID=754426 RepID=UPI000CF4CC8D|nr:triose-phosphate isomerase [Tenacibaculum sp. SG-28]PQJ20643.1 triose-phosphate isomerase [Tenacibaculum sp. SG-28]
MRNNIVAGNWKMHKDLKETKELIEGIKKGLNNSEKGTSRVIVATSFVSLTTAVDAIKESIIEVAAQNIHQENAGAFTGEVAASMVKSSGVGVVILGHSERRTYFGESNALLSKKVKQALANDLEVIFCFGELLEHRKENKHFSIVEEQLKEGLFNLSAQDFGNIVLAYEPVWAIGTGETATPEQAQEMHAFIRNVLAKKYGEEVANTISILYGGSVKPNNAKEIFSKPDVDGGLIGGASLQAEDFVAIANSF